MDRNQLEVYIQNGGMDLAISELEQERAAALARDDAAQAALATNDLGVMYAHNLRQDEARRAFQEAQAMFVRLDDPAGQGRATGNLAQLEERAGNAEQAQALYLQAADLLHEGRAFDDEYATRRRLGKLYVTRGATLQALDETTRALAVKSNPSVWDRIQCFFYRLPLQMMGLGKD